MLPIYFCHIPRTGGTTINHVLSNSYNCLKVSSHNLPNVTTECLYGHFDYEPKPGTWITFIREPHSRLESLYTYYLKHNPSLTPNEFFDKVGPNPMSKQLNSGKFDFVGIFERFESEIVRMTTFLNCAPVTLRHTHYQDNKVKLDVPPEFIKEDVKLYRHFVLEHQNSV